MLHRHAPGGSRGSAVNRPVADRVVSATVPGISPATGGSGPNTVAVRNDPRVTATIVAIAGGFGEIRGPRSDIGGRIAADVAATKAEAAVATLASTDAAALGPLGEMLADRIVEQWQAQVRDLSAAQRPGDHGDEADEDDPLRDYATALLLAIVTPVALLTMQLGEGDIVVRTDDGETVRPVAVDTAARTRETTSPDSLALADARDRFRHATVDRATSDVALVLLAAGADAAMTAAGWSEAFASDLVVQADQDGIDAVEQQLPQRVADATRSGDTDLTVVLVYPAAAVTAAAVAPTEVTDPRLAATVMNPAVLAAGATNASPAYNTSEHPAIASGAARASNRRRWIAAALVVAAIALAIVIVALADDNGSTNPATTVTTTPTSASTSVSTTTTPASTSSAPPSTAASTAAPTTVPVVVTVPPTTAPPPLTTTTPRPTTTVAPTTVPVATSTPPTT